MDILKNSRTYIVISIILVLISSYFLVFGKLNLGIDMTWGISMEYSYENSIDLEEVKSQLSDTVTEINLESQIINDSSVYSITWEKALGVVIGFYNNTNDSMSDEEKIQADKILESHKENIRIKTLDILKNQDETISESKYINIWKSFWDYIKDTAILTLLLQFM